MPDSRSGRRCGAPVITVTDRAAASRSDRSVIAFLAFIGVLTAFGIDAALPGFDELRTDFDLDGRGVSPAITGTLYFAGMAIGQLLCGVLADRFGRRNVLAGGLVLNGIGAVASAAAPDLEWLLVARFVWGLGAAAPSVLRFAIARDLYDGDRMARVGATFTAFFLIGPIFVPFVGEAILLFGSWRTVFLVGVLLAAVAFLWTLRFGETMAVEHRRPIRLLPFAEAFSSVLRTPVTLWALVGSTLFTATFFVWLGSSQPILDEVDDRDSRFTVFFGLSGAGMAVALLLNDQLIDRFGTRPMLRSRTRYPRARHRRGPRRGGGRRRGAVGVALVRMGGGVQRDDAGDRTDVLGPGDRADGGQGRDRQRDPRLVTAGDRIGARGRHRLACRVHRDTDARRWVGLRRRRSGALVRATRV